MQAIQHAQTPDQKILEIKSDIMNIYNALTCIRKMNPQNQTDIRICKLAIERVDDKVKAITKNPLK